MNYTTEDEDGYTLGDRSTCEHCGLDIEYWPGDEPWRDRGNNHFCPRTGQLHSPLDLPDFSDDFVVHTFTVTITASIDAYHQGDMRADIERAIDKVVEGTVKVKWS